MKEIVLEENEDYKELAIIAEEKIVFYCYENYDGEWQCNLQYSVSKENFKKIAETLKETP